MEARFWGKVISGEQKERKESDKIQHLYLSKIPLILLYYEGGGTLEHLPVVLVEALSVETFKVRLDGALSNPIY